MVIWVAGGRKATDIKLVHQVLDDFHTYHLTAFGEGVILVVTGAAEGVDYFAIQWARRRQIAFLGIPAKWDEEGKAAGPIRNAFISGLPIDVLVSFAGGPGTENARRLAKACGIAQHYGGLA